MPLGSARGHVMFQSEKPLGAVLRNARDEEARAGANCSSPPCGNNLTCAIAQHVSRQ